MQRVAIIIPYFGKWPVWMDFYLYTCSRQQNVDFLFFTDCGIPKTVYKIRFLWKLIILHIVIKYQIN